MKVIIRISSFNICILTETLCFFKPPGKNWHFSLRLPWNCGKIPKALFFRKGWDVLDFSEFRSRFIPNLSAQQLEAVQAVNGPVLLLAVPGSGKTTVLTARLGYMLLCQNILPEQVLTMTYTVAATREMRQRFGRVFGEDLAARMEFCTINGLCSRIIDYYSRMQGRRWPFALLENEADASRIVGDLYQDECGEFATESVIRDIRTAFTFIKNQMLTEEEIEKQDFAVNEMPELYRRYRRCLREQRLMDYDDQMVYALSILTQHPNVLEYFSDRFPYLSVDEAQDTSRIQHEIVRLLSQKHKNLFLVGDEDQSIYGFRAAWPQALLNFKKTYPEGKVLLMETNYRSTPEIVKAADAFVRRNASRYDKTIRPSRSSGSPVRFIDTVDRNAQYSYLTALAENCRHETAVLYRNNDSCLPLIDLLERSGIPYRCRNFDGTFFSHRMVLDFAAFIRLAQNPLDEDAFLRIFYKMDCCISRRSALLARDRSRTSGRPILEELSGSGELAPNIRAQIRELVFQFSQLPGDSASAALTRIWDEIHYGRYVIANSLDTGKYSILQMLARQESSAASLLQRLDRLREILLNHANLPNTPFLLSTIHSSKGLEYDRVYLLDVLDGILPAQNQMDAKKPDQADAYQEDRRLFYVAMTRAKNELHLFRCAGLSSEFSEELEGILPQPVQQEEDLFFSLFQNSCSKLFTHKTYGKGRILACEGEYQLVEYEGRAPELTTLSQMLCDRAEPPLQKKARKKAAEQAPDTSSAAAAVQPGSTVYHSVFGKGTVSELSGDIAVIQFEGGGAPRSLSLGVCLSKGLLHLRVPV